MINYICHELLQFISLTRTTKQLETPGEHVLETLEN